MSTPFRKFKRVELVELIYQLRSENQAMENENIRLRDENQALQEAVQQFEAMRKTYESLSSADTAKLLKDSVEELREFYIQRTELLEVECRMLRQQNRNGLNEECQIFMQNSGGSEETGRTGVI